jgi:hypothetical protein
MKPLVPIVVLLALLCLVPNVIPSVQKKPTKVEHKEFLVGPIPVGDLFRCMHDKDKMAVRLAKSDGPTEAEILKALDKTRMWIKDGTEKDSGKWSLENPRILLEGPLAFDLSNKKGARFEIWIRSIEIQDIGYSENNESRRVRVWVRLGTSPYRVGSNGFTSLDMNFGSTKLSYDATGKMSWLEKAEK